MKQYNETKKMMRKMMPSVDAMEGKSRAKKGKKGKKGKGKGRRQRINVPALNGMKMSDIKKLQDMMNEQ